ncbi:hypothetical protein Tco_1372980, partial [Tanacetum coccineum]
VDRWWSGGGLRWSATVDRRWPPLTATVDRHWPPLTGGPTVTPVTGAGTRFGVRTRFKLKGQYEVRISSILEADVASSDWWIQLAYEFKTKNKNIRYSSIKRNTFVNFKFISRWDTTSGGLADKQSGRPSRSLPSNTQSNPKDRSSKPYQPPQARNEHVNAVFTRSDKFYDPPDNPNDQQNDSKTPINFDSDDENDEPTAQPKPKTQKPIKETPTPKPYKPKIPYPQLLKKENMEAQYGKFLDMIRAVRINVPLVDVLAGIPNYGKFLKELVNNKHKIKQISAAFLSDESSAIL